MQKLTALFLALIMISLLSLTACGNTTEEVSTEAVTEAPTEEPTEKPTEKPTEAPTEAPTTSSKLVDVEGLKSLEEKDECKVVITKKELKRDAYDKVFATDVPDAIILSFTNNETKAVSDISIYIVAYDKDNHPVVLDTGGFSFNKDDSLVKSFKTNDTSIEPGKTEKIAIKVELGTITGVRCIISSYTVNGKEIENPIAEDWYDSAIEGQSITVD